MSNDNREAIELNIKGTLKPQGDFTYGRIIDRRIYGKLS